MVASVNDWNLGYSKALIQDIETFARLRKSKAGPIGMTSGGFDPIHPGHVSSIQHAASLLRCSWQSHGSTPRLVVVVNGDGFLREKKGREFMDLKTRCQIMAGIEGVDYVIPFEAEAGDTTVIKAIEAIKPQYFFKGGDRTGIENIPEWEVCKSNGVEIITNTGIEKCQSSSEYLIRWEAPALEAIGILQNELNELGWLDRTGL
jgi:cytidyltransferase-like protein